MSELLKILAAETTTKRRRLEDSSSSHSIISSADNPVTMDADTETSKIVIDPDGDVVFVLKDGTELQVSSKALSLASFVFKAMFGPNFQEGQNLSATSPKRVSLPDDDVAAMTTLCNILHHQSQNVSQGPDLITLVNLGVIGDKYSCSRALEPWSATWSRFYQRDLSKENTGINQLLFPFYVFNNVESFKQISKMAVYHTKGFLGMPAATWSLPNRIIEQVQKRKWEIESQLSSDLVAALDSILKADYNQQRAVLLCKGDGQRLWRYHREFKRLGLWPLSTALRALSISAVCKLLESYDDMPPRGCGCSTCLVDLRQQVRSAGSRAMQSFAGLCLTCINLGAIDISDIGSLSECHFHL